MNRDWQACRDISEEAETFHHQKAELEQAEIYVSKEAETFIVSFGCFFRMAQYCQRWCGKDSFPTPQH